MKLFRISGGVHPHDRKQLTAGLPIEDVPLPPLLHIPLRQHIGSPAAPLVRRGQLVGKGQLLAHSHPLRQLRERLSLRAGAAGNGERRARRRPGWGCPLRTDGLHLLRFVCLCVSRAHSAGAVLQLRQGRTDGTPARRTQAEGNPRLAELRSERLERQKQAKRAALARRKRDGEQTLPEAAEA